MNIETLSGRDLDRAVAEKVFGYEVVVSKMEPVSYWFYPPNISGPLPLIPYAHDMRSAWLVVEKMRELGWEIFIEVYSDRYWVSLLKDDINCDKLWSLCTTAPEAICHAALKAVAE